VEHADRFADQLQGEVINEPLAPVGYVLSGEIDLYVADALERRLREIAREHGEILDIDLADVEYCDSTGLRLFIKLTNEFAAHGGRLRLLRPSPSVVRLVRLTDTGSILDIPTTAGGATYP
jgi:anti-sigma B factor antagonist